jgi:Sulfotransferase domain
MTRQTFPISLADGSLLQIQIPMASDTYQTTFTFALHKSGSVLLDQLIEGICDHAKIPRINISVECFRRGIAIDAVESAAFETLVRRGGYCFYGFRALHNFLNGIPLARYRKLILIRDPRDILTSMYFSARSSHVIPKTGPVRERMLRRREVAAATDINHYVISREVTGIEKNYRDLMQMHDRNTKVYRYEDVIFKKREWVKDMAEWLCIDLATRYVRRIADSHDVIPTVEDQHAHIRQVKPGNHKKHLSTDAITAIELRYADILSHYGYR